MTFPRARLVPLAAACLALAACGKPAAPAAPPANGAAQTPAGAAPAFVAIARGKIDVEGGIVHLASPRDGMVSEIHAAAGDTVKAGDVLVALDARSAQAAVDGARAELGAAQAQAQLLRAKMPAATLRAGRVAEALSAGATSGQNADDARQALTELRAEVGVAEATVDTARHKLRAAEIELDARKLRAPAPGRIAAFNAHVGDMVAPGSGELVQLIPDTPRIVRAELNEGFVAKVSVGMHAEVTSDALPGKTWRATVTRIGDVFGPSKLIESAQEATDTRDVECILAVDGTDLRIGQRVQVRFLPAG